MATNPIPQTDAEPVSVFQSDLPIGEKLDRARMELLDLSARNRLLNMPRSSKGVRSIEIVDEKSAEIFRLLVQEGRVFTFVAGKAARSGDEAEVDAVEVEEITDLAQPDDDVADNRGVFSRHSDTRLQTRLTPKGLQKRLLELYFDARTLEEEQGVNILYLAMGTLKWIDPSNASNIRYAPLLLVPVSLERGNAGEKFKLRVRTEEFASNLSLEAYLDRVHGIRIPEFEATDGFDPIAYMDKVGDAVSAKPDWSIQHDEMALGFFSFAKFLMYRDLDPETWPEHARISEQPLIRGLLSDGFDGAGGMIPEDANIDPFIPPADMMHIVDCDSSQALAVHEVRRGRDMVIQGPPGTGKSQTIANIVASAVADGKTVLFVAEKMAALEVVKRRLDATGVGDACLELHSNKANKRALLDELRRTWELGAPKGDDPGTLHARLTEARDNLNGHAARMHRLHASSALTPYQAIGQLVRLRSDGERPNDLVLEAPTSWTADEFSERHGVLSELVERVEAIGRPADHVWRGVGLSSVTPMDVERFIARFAAMSEHLQTVEAGQSSVASTLEQPAPNAPSDVAPLVRLARRIAEAPPLVSEALASNEWNTRHDDISTLLQNGARLTFLRQKLKPNFVADAWSADTSSARRQLGLLPEGFSRQSFTAFQALAELLPRLKMEGEALAQVMGRDAPMCLADVRRLARVGERVVAAPDASADAFAADLWDTGVERAGDLAEAVERLEQAREAIGDGLTEAAWSMDLAASRAVLASHGTGFFKIFSGEWRQANRLVCTVVSHPEQPLGDTLAQLDALAKGQKAQKAIEEEDAFARSAFGADWRGVRSSSAGLIGLVEWMRSLKGLGAEPRIVAANRPDRDAIDLRIGRCEALVTEILPLLNNIWAALPLTQVVFGEALTAERAELDPLIATIAAFHSAEKQTADLSVSVPESLPERLALLDDLAEGQRCAATVETLGDLGRNIFTPLWSSDQSDWQALREVSEWVVANEDIRPLASRVLDRGTLPELAGRVETAIAGFVSDLEALLSDLRCDIPAALGVDDLSSLDFAAMRERLTAWTNGEEQLSKWVAYRDRADRGRALGCADCVARLEDGRLAPDRVIPAFEMAYYEALYSDQIARDPELGRFDGTLHGRLASEFANLDNQRIASASLEVVRAHHQRVPPRDGGAVGPLGTLRAEMQKKRGHMPIRKLMDRAGPAIQALKPVFMMSPLSVAQFLAPGVFEFDLLVMDEASQIQPVDALGAVARAKQVVVVGDPKQLPPTAFFSKMTGNNDEDDEDGAGRVGDIESILGLFTARGLPMRMLRWHYRSRHQSLIAVSNRQFYESKLFIVPSPYTAEAGMGLRFNHIPHGLFDAGNTRTNQVEAKVVAQAIITHAYEHPELSLGVAAFSAAQRRAILDQLEIMRRALPPEVEDFFRSHPSEPFFVKNLENVQGDERDVIFISVGYGPTVAGGRVPMRFGPLGTEGGERRLNVLISRAKQRCEVFASMTDEDIDPDFAQSRKGVFAFRLFLHFARTGRMTMAESTGRDHDSVFEEQVAKALQERGYQVSRQVGLAGFFFDLAIADPERPGRYLLGIECDGAAYHDARSARERDRLRQSVLESHGWTIHRLWSTDWFHRPNEQLDAIIAKIEAAKAEHDEDAPSKPKRAVPVEIIAIEREDVTEMGLVASGENADGDHGKFYVEAAPERPAHCIGELHETPTGTLVGLVEEVVAVEGPVHIDEVIERIRSAWGLKRAGGRIQQAIEDAAKVAVGNGKVTREGDFLAVLDVDVIVRDRSLAISTTLRRADRLPPAEIAVAILDIVRGNFGATRDQIVQAVSRAVGNKATSSTVREMIEGEINRVAEEGRLVEQAGLLVVVDG
jgi:very-short-patch-repair endonuclease